MDINFIMSAVGFKNYKNEFETMKLLVKNPQLQMSVHADWHSTKVENNTTLRKRQSINFREQGNKLFQDSPERNALDASNFYTKAILAAPPGSEALAFAHANRAMALQKFGYFQQAYDDCECALEQGYPKNLRYKVIARQAICAEKLGEPVLLQKHKDSLAALSLNKTYTALVEELQQSLEKLKLEEKSAEKNEQNDKECRGENITKITSNGKCLIAAKSIKKDELIFTERAHSFIPASKRHVCHYCAVTQLIPFPCYNCFGRVVYCSLKCRVAQQTTHAYECLGFQKDIFDTRYTIALRMVLDELPEIISFLCQKRTAKDIWNELTCEKSNLMQSKLQYTQSLRMRTHLEKKPLPDIYGLANTALLFSWYLRYQTNFFNLFKNTKARIEDWHLVIASLILRHMGQIQVADGTLQILAIKITDPSDSTLLVNKLWQSPFHVRRGFLHMFCNTEDLICATFPHLNLCNNACFVSMVTKTNGRYLSLYAVDNIKVGTELLTVRSSLYTNSTRLDRQNQLKSKFYIECKCVKCTKENPDEDFEKLKRFCCEKCYEHFTADLALNIRCTECGAVQHKVFEKIEYLHNLLHKPPEGMLEFYHQMKRNGPPQDMFMIASLLNTRNKAYLDLDQWLVGPNAFKIVHSRKIVEKCFEIGDIVFSQQFNFYDFSQIIEILKFGLRYEIDRIHLKSIDFVKGMTYLWDFIALGKYQCTAKEMEEMLQAIEILPDETKKLFINYYNDYIVGNIK